MREKGRKKKNRQMSTIKMEEWSVRRILLDTRVRI